jgi:hypothetical protein
LTDKRLELGLTLRHDNGSRLPVLFDSNNDGRLDVKVIGFRETASNFFRQNPNGTFALIPDSAGMTCPTASEWAQLIDIDASGTLELLCGGGTFPSKVTNYVSGTGVKVPFPATNATRDALTGDFNNDGRQDIVYVRGGFRLNGVSQPNATTVEAHIAIDGGNATRTLTLRTIGSLSTDLNMDNWNYIIEGGTTSGVFIGSTGYHPTSLALNLAPGGNNLGIRNPGTTPGLYIGYANGAWNVTLRSLSGFGNLYLVVHSTTQIAFATLTSTHGDEPIAPKLSYNTPTGFVDATVSSGLRPERCDTGFAADLDNDMDLDLFLGCRAGTANIADVIYENLGNGTFRKVMPHGAEGLIGSAMTDHAGLTESAVCADYDVDGFMDLFVTNGLNLIPQHSGGQAQLFHNRGNSNHWIEIDLRGVTSNRDGVGAKVYVTAGGITQYREQNGGYHRWSQNSSVIHVGLAGNTTSKVVIRWPRGTVDTYPAVAADALYQATEGQALSPLIAPQPRQ